MAKLKTKSHKTRYRKRELKHAEGIENAQKLLGAISPGLEIYLMTVGQIHAINIIEWCIDQIGKPVNLDISTWTIARFEIDNLAYYIEGGKIKKLRFITDRSFKTRHPDILSDLIEIIGIDNIRMLRCHAKFATIQNDDWHLAIRTSANLNSNPRIENYEISDDPALCAYMTEIVDEIFSLTATIGRREMKDLKSIGYRKQKDTDTGDPFAIETVNTDWTL